MDGTSSGSAGGRRRRPASAEHPFVLEGGAAEHRVGFTVNARVRMPLRIFVLSQFAGPRDTSQLFFVGLSATLSSSSARYRSALSCRSAGMSVVSEHHIAGNIVPDVSLPYESDRQRREVVQRRSAAAQQGRTG